MIYFKFHHLTSIFFLVVIKFIMMKFKINVVLVYMCKTLDMSEIKPTTN